jgi:hypothetical protein
MIDTERLCAGDRIDYQRARKCHWQDACVIGHLGGGVWRIVVDGRHRLAVPGQMRRAEGAGKSPKTPENAKPVIAGTLGRVPLT